MASRSVSYIAHVGVLFAIYSSTARLGLSFDAVSGFATAVWPPTGIALAALTLGGARLWPGIALGAFLVNVGAGAPVLAAGGMAVGNTSEALLGAYCLRGIVQFRPELDRLRDVLGLVGLAAGLSSLVSATLGVTSGWLSGVIPAAHVGPAWWTWWLGDVMGALVVAPLVCVWYARPRLRLPPARLAEAGVLVLTVGAVSVVVFDGLWTLPDAQAPYLLFPVLIWAALRFGPQGAVTAIGLVSSLAIWATAQSLGPFASDTRHTSLLRLQVFMGVVTVTSLVLAAAVAERRRAEAQQARLYHEAQAARATAEESLALLDTLLATAPVGFAFMDPELRYRRINDALAAINGLPPAAHLGRTLHEVLPDLTPLVEPLHRQVLETGGPLVNVEIHGKRPTTPTEPGAWLASYYPVRVQDGRVLGVGVVVIEITERQRAAAVRAQLAAIVESSDDAIMGKTLAGVITSWNAGAERLYGYAADEIIGQPVTLLMPPERAEEWPAIRERLRRSQRLQHFETVRMRKDGQRIDVSLSISPLQDAHGQVIGAAVIARDITARKQVEAQLKASLQEKEVLLKEVHHRVKNNLQVISSLLNLQARRLPDASLRDMFGESQQRIQVMALIHQTLYESRDVGKLEVGAYLRTLALQVFRSYGIRAERIRLHVESAEVWVDLHTAMPCGLLLHELLSNCLKHAFPGGRSGDVYLILRGETAGRVTLIVRDTGIGVPAGRDVHTTGALGWRLVQLLAAQLDGTLTVDHAAGTTVTLTFAPGPTAEGGG
jgi:PAS domain S-box-containing protein